MDSTRDSLYLTNAYSKTVQTYYMVCVYTFCKGYFNFKLKIIDKKKWVMCKIVWKVFLATKQARPA